MKNTLFTPAFSLLLALGSAIGVVGALGVAPSVALAQSSMASAQQGDTLYAALGEKAGLVLLTDDFVSRLKADPRTASHFKDANAKHLSEMLTQQFCKLSGGPCTYEGGDMKTVHRQLDITKTDFNALVEILQQSMDARGIAFTSQNRLLARLAPMHRDIITVK